MTGCGVRERPGPRDSERRLIEGDAAGDASRGFIGFYRAHYEALCRFAFHVVQSRSDAEEIVHDVFLRLWTRYTAEGGRGGMAEWAEREGVVYVAVRNEAIDRLRRRRREERALESSASELDDGGAAVDDALAAAEVAAEVQRAVDALPPRAREVLLLKWQRGLTNAQVAESLGIARKTVEMHVTRAARALRELLRRPLGGD